MTELRAEVTLTVPFHDADPAGMVWHGRYPKYFEQARCKLMALIGYGYREMAQTGFVWPVVDLHVRYGRPLRFSDRITVCAVLTEWEYRLAVEYRILREGQETTRGKTIQVPVEQATDELLIGCPAVFTDLVEAALQRVGPSRDAP